MDQQVSPYLERIAEEYRKEGYDVVVSPDRDALGDLGDIGVDLIARRGNEVVAVQAKGRDELYDLGDIQGVAKRVESRPGWRFDVVVLPAESAGEAPQNGAELGGDQILSLMKEAKKGLASGTMRSSFLIAWTAVEAAMRSAAKREGLVIDRESPQLLLKTVYSNGLVSRRDYQRGKQFLQVRNALVHGFDPPRFDAADIDFLLGLAERLAKAAA